MAPSRIGFSFVRLSAGPDAGAWYNEFFFRGYPNSMHGMVRVKIKDRSRLDNPFDDIMKEPDFYSMTPLPVAKKNMLSGGDTAVIYTEQVPVIPHDRYFPDLSEAKPHLTLPPAIVSEPPIIMYQYHVQATSFRPTRALSCDEVDRISLLITMEPLPFKVESSISLLEAMEPLPFKAGVPCDDWAYLAQSLKNVMWGF